MNSMKNIKSGIKTFLHDFQRKNKIQENPVCPNNLIQSRDENFITVQNQTFCTTRKNLHKLIELVPQHTVMVEVGSLAGFSTRIFSLYFDKVISVDPYISGYDAKDGNSEPIRLRLARDLFTLRFFDDPRVEQINKKSEEAVYQFEDNSLDFVYIDAGHFYEAVKIDIQIWMPKVKKGFFIAGDDYEWPGVAQAVQELVPNHKVIHGRWIARVGN
jgi:predicted O-methyltransferase YrrM